MDGKEYVISFDVVVPPAPDYDAIIDRKGVLHAAELNLVGKIALLYGAGEVHTIGSRPPGEAVRRAHVQMSDSTVDRIIASEQRMAEFQARASGTDPLPPVRYMTAAQLASIDETDSMSPQELLMTVENGREERQAVMVGYSDMVMDLSLKNLHRAGKRRELRTNDAATAIKAAIGNNRVVFNELVAPAAGTITIERDFKLSRANIATDEIEWRVNLESIGRYIPKWLKATKEFDEPLQLICSLYTELETLIALQEWVIDRKLPYLPIATPYAFERGDMAEGREMNLHSDILLCCLQPERNEIIPVQVKNRVHRLTREEYDDEVVLVSNQDLGTRSASTCVVEYDGGRHTGRRISDVYGLILGHYLRVRGTTGTSRTPTKADRRAFADVLRPAFNHFDHEIGRRIQSYGSV